MSRHPFRPLLAAGMVVTAAGLVVSATMALAQRRSETATAAGVVGRRAELVARAVEVEVSRYISRVRMVAAAMSAVGQSDARAFAVATEPLSAMPLAGATSMSLVVEVAHDQVAAAQNRWRQLGVDDLVLRPVGDGPHLFVVFDRPLNGPARLIRGADLSARDEAARTLARARQSRDVAVSDTYRLLVDRRPPGGRQQLSFMIAAPVLGPAGPGGARELRGWVVMGLRGQDFLIASLRDVAQGTVDVSLQARNAGGVLVPVAALHLPTDAPRDIRRDVTALVARRRWLLRVDGVSAVFPGRSDLPLATAIGGTLLSLLLGALVLVLSTGRERARAQVLAATAELRAAQASLRRDHEHSRAVAAVATSIATAGIDSARVAATVAEELAGRVADDVAVVQLDPATGRFRCLKAVSHDPVAADEWCAALDRAGLRIDGGSHLARAAWDGTTVALRIDDAAAFWRGVAEGFGPLLATRPVHHVLIVPSLLHGAITVILTGRRDRQPFSTREVELIEDVAARAGLAISNARLFEQSAAAEAAARRSQTQLEQINADLDHFAATAAHDLRAPLGTIAGFSQLVASKYAEVLDDDALEYLAEIDDSARHLGKLTADLLTLARVRDQDLVLAQVDLAAVARQACRNLRSVIEETAAEISIDPLPVVTGDEGLLERLIQNLVANALKYQPRGQHPVVRISARRDAANHVTVQVTDNGIGIDPDQADAIFQPFHRSPAATGYTGSGLGLAVCRRIVERHGGHIWAALAPGEGTTIVFTLPVAIDLDVIDLPDPTRERTT